MPKAVETLLTSIGITPEDVTKIVSAPDDDATPFDVNPYSEKVKTNYKTQFENDPTFFSGITVDKLPAETKKSIEKAQYGRAADIARKNVLRGLGMTEADYADLTDDEKEKLELFVPKIVEKYTKTKAGDKEVQQQLIEARKKLEELGNLEETLKTKYEGETENKISGAIFNANVLTALASIDGLKISPADVAKTAQEILLSDYGYARTGDFGIELRQKANPTLKVLKENSSEELTLVDALTAIATKRNWVEKKVDDGKGGKGKGSVTITPEGSNLVVAPHVQDRINRKIASEAKQ